MTFPPDQAPVAPERNPPIEPQNFQPSVFTISAITRGVVTMVTTVPAYGNVNNNYVLGQEVRFLIPPTYGIQQLNGQTALVVGIPGVNQVTVNIDSRNYNIFVPTPAYGPTPPQIVAIGDTSSGIISSTGRSVPTTTVPGAFINISPVEAG
jgi:hypothetical protein